MYLIERKNRVRKKGVMVTPFSHVLREKGTLFRSFQESRIVLNECQYVKYGSNPGKTRRNFFYIIGEFLSF